MKAKINGREAHTLDLPPETGYNSPVWVYNETKEVITSVDQSFMFAPGGGITDFDFSDGKHIGNFIRMMRQTRTMFTMSQQKLAEKTGLSIGTIQNIESNKVAPSVSNLCKVLDALGMRLVVAKK